MPPCFDQQLSLFDTQRARERERERELLFKTLCCVKVSGCVGGDVQHGSLRRSGETEREKKGEEAHTEWKYQLNHIYRGEITKTSALRHNADRGTSRVHVWIHQRGSDFGFEMFISRNLTHLLHQSRLTAIVRFKIATSVLWNVVYSECLW